MTSSERINTQKGAVLVVEKRTKSRVTEISLLLEESKRCLLHWGIRRDANAPWRIPPKSAWPEGTQAFDHGAVQTPFLRQDGVGKIIIELEHHSEFALIDFVLYFPDEGRWDNNSGRNYQIEIPREKEPSISPDEILRKELLDDKHVVFEQLFNIYEGLKMAAVVKKDKRSYRVTLLTDAAPPLVLHWGIAVRSRYEWQLPPLSMLPDGTTIVDDKAVQTPFVEHKGLRRLDLEIEEANAPVGLSFVLGEPKSNRWIKDRGRNFHVPIAVPPQHVVSFDNAALSAIADEIVEKEMSRNSWTLMHRYNLCYDLLDKALDAEDGLALIYVWLRFSALRQLDWQRNYNTKPRELGHSLDRLTLKLAVLFGDRPERREYIRLIMTTLGRGTDAQRVRDEVLHIMHRHHIKEVSGHFMEEWHQKLHNNSTPDDIVICQALIAFLKNDGNLDIFFDTLEEGGVTRERLESYERPIRSNPDFIPHLKDALIRDFEHFLGILKEVHNGTDLGVAIKAAGRLVDGQMRDLLDSIWSHRDGRGIPIRLLVERITEARRRLAERLKAHNDALRDLIFLDLALEDFLRTVLERGVGSSTDREELAGLIEIVLENLSLSHGGEESTRCRGQWQRLMKEPHFGREWSLQAKSVMDRLGIHLGSFIERYTRDFQPKAEYLGRAFRADLWTVNLFSEEIVRGRLEFVLSLLMRLFDPILRRSAHLGNWQVISPGSAAGRVEVTRSLRSIQGKHFSEATVIVTDHVAGDEEIPEGVTAVITPDATDIVSHVAIRARNDRVLFATCHEPEEVERLRALSGREIKLSVDAVHNVLYEETSDVPQLAPRPIRPVAQVTFQSTAVPYAISANDFNNKAVGGKSNNLTRLIGGLPKWIALPSSVAMPFGVFERVLGADVNKAVTIRYHRLAGQLETVREDTRSKSLSELRDTIQDLVPPDDLIPSLRKVMQSAGLPAPSNWDDAWMQIKRVWASKWNERAFLSRTANGIPHDSLFMAVLIQEVVKADYSFVIHTANPFTGDKDEVYAEVVIGLGETLVGNYPGRALSFTCKKQEHEPVILAYPSKSEALYGSGLIFRSDSNGEDLPGYAGAGLYDSFMLPAARRSFLDYATELLLWNEHFRKSLLVTIALIGSMVEKAVGSHQDIEGAYSKGQYYVIQTRPQAGLDA